MDDHASGARAGRFAASMSSIAEVLGDPRRRGPMTSYCTGLLMPADRKSVMPEAC
jgi:SRSO17 transposase